MTNEEKEIIIEHSFGSMMITIFFAAIVCILLESFMPLIFLANGVGKHLDLVRRIKKI